VVLGGLLVIVPLSYIMQNEFYFSWGLIWVTRLVMSLVLSVWSIWYLLELGVNKDTPSLGLSCLALLLVILGNSVVLLPYECCKAHASCPVLAIVYLLCLVTCPVLFLNWCTYISPFIQLVSHQPVPVGLLGFSMELLKQYLCPNIMERAIGLVFSLPQADDTGSILNAKRHIMVSSKKERMDRLQETPRWESDAEDADALMVDSSGCCSSLWHKRLRRCCRRDTPWDTSRDTPRHPRYGEYHESAETLPVWSGNGGFAPL